MKKIVLSLCLALSLLLGCLPGAAALWEPDFPLEGASFYLVELNTGEEILTRNIHERRSPASLTKMMTVLLTIEAGVDWNDVVTVPQSLAEELELIEAENGMSIYMKPGERFTVEQLLYLTMLSSCNDAASVLADYVGGGLEPFIARMNARARELGCTQTDFNCAHGLFEEIGEGNWSSAADMALIARECIRHPEFMKLATATQYWLPLSETRTRPHFTTERLAEVPEGMYRLMYSTNPLQRPEDSLYRSYDRGLKTGYTTWAEKCFVTLFEGTDTRYLLVELGVPNENTAQGEPLVFQQAVRLGDWVMKDFHLNPLVTEGEDMTFTRVLYSSDGDTLRLLASDDLSALVCQGDSITREITRPEQLEAPIAAGAVVGSMTYYRNGEPLGTVDLVAAADMRYSAFEYVKAKVSAFFDTLLGKGH